MPRSPSPSRKNQQTLPPLHTLRLPTLSPSPEHSPETGEPTTPLSLPSLPPLAKEALQQSPTRTSLYVDTRLPSSFRSRRRQSSIDSTLTNSSKTSTQSLPSSFESSDSDSDSECEDVTRIRTPSLSPPPFDRLTGECGGLQKNASFSSTVNFGPRTPSPTCGLLPAFNPQTPRSITFPGQIPSSDVHVRLTAPSRRNHPVRRPAPDSATSPSKRKDSHTSSQPRFRLIPTSVERADAFVYVPPPSVAAPLPSSESSSNPSLGGVPSISRFSRRSSVTPSSQEFTMDVDSSPATRPVPAMKAIPTQALLLLGPAARFLRGAEGISSQRARGARIGAYKVVRIA